MKKGQKIVLSVMCMFVVILAAVLVITIKKELDYKASFPKPEDATQICVSTFTDGTLFFNDNKGGHLVVANDSTLFQNFIAKSGSTLNTMILVNASDDTVKRVCDFSSRLQIENLYVPSGISEENIALLKEAFPDGAILGVKKGSQVVSGSQYILTFLGTEQDMAFVLEHGYDSYFYASSMVAKVGGLKNKSFLLSVCSLDCLTESAFTVNNAVLTTGDDRSVDSISEGAFNFAFYPLYNAQFYSDGKGDCISDIDFSPTGKLEE